MDELNYPILYSHNMDNNTVNPVRDDESWGFLLG